MAKIQVARVDNGEKVWIPEHWMKDPTLKIPFRTLPSARASEAGEQTSESAASATTPSTTTATRGSTKPKE